MLKLFTFIILLCSSRTFGLLETLFETENNCYSICQTKYDNDLSSLIACRKGCDFKLHGESCTKQCNILSIDEHIRTGCFAGCLSGDAEANESPKIEFVRPIMWAPLPRQPPFSGELRRVNFDEVVQQITDADYSNEILMNPFYKGDDQFRVGHAAVFHKQDTPSADDQIKPLTDIPSRDYSWVLFAILLLSCIPIGYMISLIYRDKSTSNDTTKTDKKALLKHEYKQHLESSAIKV